MNFDSYLRRIGFHEPVKPDLATLGKLQQAHLLAVPFENLDIHWGREIRLDIDRIYDKVIGKKRGGFCYELNGLFFELLQCLGYEVQRISARVHSPEKQEYGPEFDHLGILVQLGEKQYLTDVGYGEFLLSPLKIELNTIQADTRGQVYALRQHDESYLRVEKRVDDEWKPEYIFTQKVRAYHEFQAMCDYQQHDPNSYFQKQKHHQPVNGNGANYPDFSQAQNPGGSQSF